MTSLPNQLRSFAGRAQRLLPTALWWVLAALISAIASINLEEEIFPNTPAAVRLAVWVALGCGAALPPLGVVWLWRVAAQVAHPGWRLLWYLAAVGALGLVLLALLGTVVFLMNVTFI